MKGAEKASLPYKLLLTLEKATLNLWGHRLRRAALRRPNAASSSEFPSAPLLMSRCAGRKVVPQEWIQKRKHDRRGRALPPTSTGV